jgi:chemotaxis protein MotB
MTNHIRLSTLSAFAFIVLLGSCVSANKYERLNAEKIKYQGESEQCRKDIDKLTADFEKANEELAGLNKRLGKLTADSATMAVDFDRAQKLYKDLNITYESLLKNHERLASNSTAEQNKLSKDLALREKEIMAIEANLVEAQQKVKKLNDDLLAREKKMKELENILSEKEKSVNALKAQISDALLSFKESDLTVQVKNGKVYVSLSEDLLFKSGSYSVDNKGKDALKKVSGVLKTHKEVIILVEGHTDDVPITKGTAGMQDNWDLSVLRANAIVRILQNEGVPAENLTAAGRSQYSPIDSAKNSAARQKNRRTELILTPRLDDLFKILE